MGQSPDQKNLLAVFTGPPCVGKSTLAGALVSAIESRGITSRYIEEFDYFWPWVVAQDQSDSSLLSWGEPSAEDGHRPVYITDKGYRLAFEHVNHEVAKEYNTHASKSGLTVVEGARARGGVPYSHYFQGLDRGINGHTKFANIEVSVGDTSKHLQRAIDRIKTNSFAAPIEVVREYLDEAPRHPTAYQDASRFPRIIINERVTNDGTPEQAVLAMEGIIGQVLRYFR